MAAMGPGMSKSITAKHFESCYSNVYLVTISPATSGIRAMLRAVLYAMGVASPPGDIQSMSMQIKDRASKLQDPLLILDEAQHQARLADAAVAEDDYLQQHLLTSRHREVGVTAVSGRAGLPNTVGS